MIDSTHLHTKMDVSAAAAVTVFAAIASAAVVAVEVGSAVGTTTAVAVCTVIAGVTSVFDGMQLAFVSLLLLALFIVMSVDMRCP